MMRELTRWYVVDRHGEPTRTCPYRLEANADTEAYNHNHIDMKGWTENRPYSLVRLVPAIVALVDGALSAPAGGVTEDVVRDARLWRWFHDRTEAFLAPADAVKPSGRDWLAGASETVTAENYAEKMVRITELMTAGESVLGTLTATELLALSTQVERYERERLPLEDANKARLDYLLSNATLSMTDDGDELCLFLNLWGDWEGERGIGIAIISGDDAEEPLAAADAPFLSDEQRADLNGSKPHATGSVTDPAAIRAAIDAAVAASGTGETV